MRPVDTWKSTAAEPTPIRLGPEPVPAAVSPWQVEQPCRWRARPALTAALSVESAALPLGASTDHSTPVAIRASERTSVDERRRRRALAGPRDRREVLVTSRPRT